MSTRSSMMTIADFSRAVSSARKQAGWTQRELALRAGVSREWINKLENVPATADLSKVLDVFNALGLEIVSGTDHSPAPSPQDPGDPYADLAIDPPDLEWLGLPESPRGPTPHDGAG